MLGAAAMLMGDSYAPFSVGLSTPSVAGSSSSSTVTSTSVQALLFGGSGRVDVNWVCDNPAIVPTASGSQTTAFQATGVGVGGSLSGGAQATIRDKVTGKTKLTGVVSVYLERGYPALSGSVSGASQTGNSSSVINITAGASASGEGGVPPYSYEFGGGAGFTISPSGSVCYYGVALGPGQSASATGYVIIRDSIGQATPPLSFPISCANTGTAPSPLSVWVNESSVAGISSGPSSETPPVTGFHSGGVGPFTTQWVKLSGAGAATGGSGPTSTFVNDNTQVGIPLGGSFAFVVTDHGNGNAQKSAGVSATFHNYGFG